MNEPSDNSEVLVTVTSAGNEVVVFPFDMIVTASLGDAKVDCGVSVMVLVRVELGVVCVTTWTDVI